MLYPIELDPALAHLPFILDVAGEGLVMSRIDVGGVFWCRTDDFEGWRKEDG